MKSNNHNRVSLVGKLTAGLFLSALSVMQPAQLFAGNSFLGVASGDTSDIEATLWTRAVDTNAPAATVLTAQVGTNSTFNGTVLSYSTATVTTNDYTAKVQATGLLPNTKYFYRFTDGLSNSITGTFKTAPGTNTASAIKFAFSGDADGLMRPYALARDFDTLDLDFFIWLGDTIYENASSNSPSVTLSGSIPAPSATGATKAQLAGDYAKKYREQFLAVNPGGQNGLQNFFAAQGNYTLLDNHELGNRQYINGGAPAGGPVGDMPSGAGVDARVSSNDTNFTGVFMNQATGFQILQQVYVNYQPVRDRGIHNVPADPRTHGTKVLYFAQQWGKNVVFINADDRTYRDLRMKTSANADETGSRADNTNRTMFGATQLAWLEQTLLAAQNNGVPWKFVATSDPIDQLGPIGGALTTVTNGGNTGYVPVSADGGKSFMGGYRAERNALMKFIADNKIYNVIFMATDDHQNRVNELFYSTNGQTSVQATYAPVPGCFSIVDGPLGATGPDLVTNHTFANNKVIADSLAAAQSGAGVDPVGLAAGYPGLHNVFREGDPGADAARQPADFYSPDTFNYNTLEVGADGKTLTVKSFGMNATAQNGWAEYDSTNNPVRQIFGFQVDALEPVTAPTLAYAQTGNTILLSWPTAYNTYGLQAQTNTLTLGINTNWTDVSGVTNNSISLPIDNNQPCVFYRLKRP